MVDDVHTRLVVDADFRKLHDAVNQIKRAREESDRAQARSMNSPRDMARSFDLMKRYQDISVKRGVEIEGILKRQGVAEKDFLNTVKASIAQQEKQVGVIGRHKGEVAGLISNYINLAAGVSAVAMSIQEFAQDSEAMRLIGQRFRMTREETEKLEKQLDVISDRYGKMDTEVRAIYSTLQQTMSKLSSEQAVRLSDSIARASRQYGIQSQVLAQGLGEVMNTMGIAAEKGDEALNIITTGMVRARMEGGQFANYLGQMTELMEELGEKGTDGLSRTMTILEQMRTQGFGNTMRTARAFQQSLQQIRAGGGVAKALGLDEDMWNDELERVEKRGGSMIDFYIGEIKRARRETGQSWQQLFPNYQMQKFWKMMVENQDLLKRKQRELGDESQDVAKRIKSDWETQQDAINKLMVTITQLAGSFGQLLDAVGVTDGMKSLTRELKDIANLFERITDFLKWIEKYFPKVLGDTFRGMANGSQGDSVGDRFLRGDWEGGGMQWQQNLSQQKLDSLNRSLAGRHLSGDQRKRLEEERMRLLHEMQQRQQQLDTTNPNLLPGETAPGRGPIPGSPGGGSGAAPSSPSGGSGAAPSAPSGGGRRSAIEGGRVQHAALQPGGTGGLDTGAGTGGGQVGGGAAGGFGGTQLAAMRAPMMAEINRDPATKRLVMQMMATEGGAGGGQAALESLLNRTAMIREKVPNWSIAQELRSGFYGPINRGEADRRAISGAQAARYEKIIGNVAGGSNMIQGRTDQGLTTDPNGRGPGRLLGLGHSTEVYNWWKGSRRGAQFTHETSRQWMERINRAAQTSTAPPPMQGSGVPLGGSTGPGNRGNYFPAPDGGGFGDRFNAATPPAPMQGTDAVPYTDATQLRSSLEQPIRIPVQLDTAGGQFVRPGIDRAWKSRVAREEAWNSNYDIGVA